MITAMRDFFGFPAQISEKTDFFMQFAFYIDRRLGPCYNCRGRSGPVHTAFVITSGSRPKTGILKTAGSLAAFEIEPRENKEREYEQHE